MRRHLRTIAAATLLALAPPTAFVAGAQTVSGRFVLGDTPLTPRHVAAFRVRDQRAPRAWQTSVMLTLTPVDVAAIRVALDPYAVSINDPAVQHADYLSIFISADGVTTVNAHVGGTQYLDSTAAMMGTPGSLVAACTENTAARIACTVKTVAPVQPMSGPPWTLDVTFASSIAARAVGTPLPTDGGPAGRALLALVAAASGTNLAKMLALITPEQVTPYRETWRSAAENLASAKEMLGARLPKHAVITGGEQITADAAVLEVEGRPFPGRTMLYLVEMIRVDGHWRWADARPVGLLR